MPGFYGRHRKSDRLRREQELAKALAMKVQCFNQNQLEDVAKLEHTRMQFKLAKLRWLGSPIA